MINRFYPVSGGISEKRGIVRRMLIEAGARRPVVASAMADTGVPKCIHGGTALCFETPMSSEGGFGLIAA
jgi:hypothetical protein